MPVRAAGCRIEPPVSVPSAPNAVSEATAAAEPPLEPPGTPRAIRGVKLPAVAATIGARRCPAPADLLPSFHDLRDDEKAVCLARRIAQCLFRRKPIPWRVFAKDIENWDAMRGSFYAAYI